MPQHKVRVVFLSVGGKLSRHIGQQSTSSSGAAVSVAMLIGETAFTDVGNFSVRGRLLVVGFDGLVCNFTNLQRQREAEVSKICWLLSWRVASWASPLGQLLVKLKKS